MSYVFLTTQFCLNLKNQQRNVLDQLTSHDISIIISLRWPWITISQNICRSTTDRQNVLFTGERTFGNDLSKVRPFEVWVCLLIFLLPYGNSLTVAHLLYTSSIHSYSCLTALMKQSGEGRFVNSLRSKLEHLRPSGYSVRNMVNGMLCPTVMSWIIQIALFHWVLQLHALLRWQHSFLVKYKSFFCCWHRRIPIQLLMCQITTWKVWGIIVPKVLQQWWRPSRFQVSSNLLLTIKGMFWDRSSLITDTEFAFNNNNR